MAKKKDKKNEKKDKKSGKKTVKKTRRCSLCSGTGQYKSQTGVGWNSDFYSTCYICHGKGYYEYEAKKGCFIATAAFGDYDAPEVVFLRKFRDESLSQSFLGRSFVRAYYKLSPTLAAAITKSILLRAIVRKLFLQPTISLLRHFRRE